jgi:short-subunit dehydrogenase
MPEAALLASKCCLVTGAGRGIGQAIAEAFAKNGAKLLLAARSKDQLQVVAERCVKLGASAVECYAVDLTDPKEVPPFLDLACVRTWARNVL